MERPAQNGHPEKEALEAAADRGSVRHAAELLDDIIQQLDDVIAQRGEEQLMEPGDKVCGVSGLAGGGDSH